MEVVHTERRNMGMTYVYILENVKQEKVVEEVVIEEVRD